MILYLYCLSKTVSLEMFYTAAVITLLEKRVTTIFRIEKLWTERNGQFQL